MNKPSLAATKTMTSGKTRIVANLYKDGTVRVFLPGDYTEGTHMVSSDRLVTITKKLNDQYVKENGVPFKPTTA